MLLRFRFGRGLRRPRLGRGGRLPEPDVNLALLRHGHHHGPARLGRLRGSADTNCGGIGGRGRREGDLVGLQGGQHRFQGVGAGPKLLHLRLLLRLHLLVRRRLLPRLRRVVSRKQGRGLRRVRTPGSAATAQAKLDPCGVHQASEDVPGVPRLLHVRIVHEEAPRPARELDRAGDRHLQSGPSDAEESILRGRGARWNVVLESPEYVQVPPAHFGVRDEATPELEVEAEVELPAVHLDVVESADDIFGERCALGAPPVEALEVHEGAQRDAGVNARDILVLRKSKGVVELDSTVEWPDRELHAAQEAGTAELLFQRPVHGGLLLQRASAEEERHRRTEGRGRDEDRALLKVVRPRGAQEGGHGIVAVVENFPAEGDPVPVVRAKRDARPVRPVNGSGALDLLRIKLHHAAPRCEKGDDAPVVQIEADARPVAPRVDVLVNEPRQPVHVREIR